MVKRSSGIKRLISCSFETIGVQCGRYNWVICSSLWWFLQMSFPLAVPINRHEGVSWQLVAPYTTNKQMLLPCLWALVKVDGSAFWWLYYCLSETLWSSWGSFPPQTSWEGRDCRASAVVVLFLGPWAENTRGACVCVGQKKCTSALSMPVVANHTSFLVLDYMTQIECGQCTEEAVWWSFSGKWGGEVQGKGRWKWWR